MANERTKLLRGRCRYTFYASAITLVIAVGCVRVVELGYLGDHLLTVILVAFVAAMLFLYFVDRTFAYRAELKRLALIEDQRVYGGSYEFVSPDEVRAQFHDDNIWRR